MKKKCLKPIKLSGEKLSIERMKHLQGKNGADGSNSYGTSTSVSFQELDGGGETESIMETEKD